MRVDGKDVVVTMRTPGDDLDLAAGFLLTEGWIRTAEDIGTLAYCPDEDDPDRRNLVEARLVRSYRTSGPDRYSWANSSCGLCESRPSMASVKSSKSTIRSTKNVASGRPAPR